MNVAFDVFAGQCVFELLGSRLIEDSFLQVVQSRAAPGS